MSLSIFLACLAGGFFSGLLGIVFIGALMEAAGKLLTFQVDWRLLWPVILGSAPAALLGARISRRLSPRRLRQLLQLLVLLILVQTWYGVIRGCLGREL